MVTGDNLAIAGEISGQLGMGKTIYAADQLLRGSGDECRMADDTAEMVEQADGFAQVFPEHKYGIVKALQARGHIVGMTGDGVNDAPALKQADIGIAVSGATDAARAAASLVLTAPGLSVIINAVESARRIFERMNSCNLPDHGNNPHYGLCRTGHDRVQLLSHHRDYDHFAGVSQ